MAHRRKLVAIGKRGGKIARLSNVPGKPHEYLRQEIILPYKSKPKVRVVWRGGSSEKPPVQQVPKPPVQPEEKPKPPVEKRPSESPPSEEKKRKQKRETASAEIWDKLAEPMPGALRDALEKGRKTIKGPFFRVNPQPPRGWPGTESEFLTLVEDMGRFAAVEQREYACVVLPNGDIVAESGDEHSVSVARFGYRLRYMAHNHPRCDFASFLLSRPDLKCATLRGAVVDAISVDRKTGRVIGLRYDPHKDPENIEVIEYDHFRDAVLVPPVLDVFPDVAIKWALHLIEFLLNVRAFQTIGGDNILFGVLERVKETKPDSETAMRAVESKIRGMDWRVAFDREGNPQIITSNPQKAARLKECGFTAVIGDVNG